MLLANRLRAGGVFGGGGGALFGGRGVFGGGIDSSLNRTNRIDYITIATLGNATDFGDLTLPRNSLAATSGN